MMSMRSSHDYSRGAHSYQQLGSPSPVAMAAAAEDKFGRMTVPIFSTKWAIVLCVCNFLVPGLGTCLAGLSLCCPCSDNPSFDCADCCCSACVQFGVAALQLLLAPACLLGWVWSCVWGCAFIGRSNPEWRARTRQTREHHLLGGDAASGSLADVTTEQPTASSGESSSAAAAGGFLLGRSFLLSRQLPPAYDADAAGRGAPSRSPPPPYEEAVAEGVVSNGTFTTDGL